MYIKIVEERAINEENIFRCKNNQIAKYEYDIEIHNGIHLNTPIKSLLRELRPRIKAMCR
jgi:hypothetical protein